MSAPISSIPVLCAALLAAGCLKAEPEPLFLPAYEFVDFENEEGWIKTRPILLVSDCQLFNAYTKPLPERNLSAESLIETAIRSPQANLFSADVLEWILADDEFDTQAILYLGDALDLACEGEMTKFLSVMATAGKPWLMAPGNHDCVYFGNYIPVKPKIWQDACNLAGRPLTKDLFIRYYVAALLKQDGAAFDALAQSLGLAEMRELEIEELLAEIPLEHRWEGPRLTEELLTGIVWKIDEEEPWRSFVLQRASVWDPGYGEYPVEAFLLDTCEYLERPELIPNAWAAYPLPLNAGFSGQMLGDQLRVLREWAELNAAGDGGAAFMCHHPVDGIEVETRSNLLWLWREVLPDAMFVTAHTHDGHYVHHRLSETHEGLELNIGSTTDWPMEWRTLEFYAKPEEWGFEAYLQSRRFTMAERVRNREGFFQSGWEVPLDAPDDYRQYKRGESSKGQIAGFYLGIHLRPPVFGAPNLKAGKPAIKTETSVKDAMLWTYFRLIDLFPTDVGEGDIAWPEGCSSDVDISQHLMLMEPENTTLDQAIVFLQELEHFEASRHTRDPETGESTDELRAKYKICQAIWAARYEATGGRTLRTEDELVHVRGGYRYDSER